MGTMIEGPAVDRLRWILDGLAGTPEWGADAAHAFAPEFSAVVPVERYVALTRERSRAYPRMVVVGMDADRNVARARLRRGDGAIDVLTCVVEPEPPHRITSTWLTGLVPAGLTPRLPMDFAEYEATAPTGGGRLIVVSGVPGSGKSTFADTLGRRLGVPVFAVDWLLGALTPFGGRHLDGLLDIGAELLTTLALRQLSLGQSAILDHPAEDEATRVRWHGLAEWAGARFIAVRCVCADPAVHQARVEGRTRGIAGWHDPADWDDVTRRLADYPPWTDALTVDTAAGSPESLVDSVMARLG
jgi:predicted kinase